MKENEMYDGQVAIRLTRQFNLESNLVDELEKHCSILGELVSDFVKDTSKPLELVEAKNSIANFIGLVEETNASRKKLFEFLHKVNFNVDETPLRQIIDTLSEPFRTNLNSHRRDLSHRIRTIKTNVAADFSVVYHSFDFFRRMIDGLVDRVAEEQCYDPAGRTANSDLGNFVRKAC